MKMVRERILADVGLQYREGVNAVYHMLRAACSSSHYQGWTAPISAGA